MLPVSLADLDAGEGPTIDAALAREKGDALFDARHRVVFSANYVLPAFEDRGGFVRHAFGGWSLNAIVQAQSGFALTVTEPVDVALTSLTNRPDVVCDPNAGGARTVEQWFDTRCFSRLTLASNAGRIGDAGRGIVRGPGLRAHRPVAGAPHRSAAASSTSSCASRRSTCSIRIGWATRASAWARRPSA